MASHKTEWVEPSYGCCFMSTEDHHNFKNAVGTDRQRIATRNAILQNYETQLPFCGDGKLFYLTDFDAYQNDLPKSVKVNAPHQEEQIAKSKILETMSGGNMEFKTTMLNRMPSISREVKTNAIVSSQNKSSISRKKEEGVKNNTGNLLKSVSLPSTPLVEDISETVSEEFQDAKNQSEGLIAGVIDNVISPTKEFFAEKYNLIKENYASYKEQIATLTTDIRNAYDDFTNSVASQAAALVGTIAGIGTLISQVQSQLQSNITNNFNSALTNLNGAFDGLEVIRETGSDEYLNLFYQYSDTSPTDGGSATQSNCTGYYSGGVTRNGCPNMEGYGAYSIGQFRGYQATCFTPRNLSIASIEQAGRQATEYAQQRNGNAWNDCRNRRFVVFWNVE